MTNREKFLGALTFGYATRSLVRASRKVDTSEFDTIHGSIVALGHVAAAVLAVALMIASFLMPVFILPALAFTLGVLYHRHRYEKRVAAATAAHRAQVARRVPRR